MENDLKKYLDKKKTKNMEKEIIQILLSNRSIRTGELLSEKIGLNLKDRFKTFPSLVVAIDEVFYLLQKLEKLDYIKIKHNLSSTANSSSFFDGIPVVTKDEKEEISGKKIYWFVKHVEKIYDDEIITNFGLIKYIKNKYKTDEEVNWHKTVVLSISVALVTALFTAIFTAYLNSTPIINYINIK